MSQGHIRSQGEGSWQLKFDLGRDPVTGKRKSKFVTFRGNKRQAQAELTRLLAQRDAGSYVDPTKMTLAEYLNHWLSVWSAALVSVPLPATGRLSRATSCPALGMFRCAN